MISLVKTTNNYYKIRLRVYYKLVPYFKRNEINKSLRTKKLTEAKMKATNNISVIFNRVDVCKVSVFSRELLQVFLNIMKNAKEAFENKNIENKIIEISIRKINETVKIEIYDNAGNIDEKIKDKIFDPYFSTKDEKTGTGLGMYMSKTIIKKHLNGQLGFYNKDEGVVFFIDLISQE